MHTDTEHTFAWWNLVGRWCQETPDTGRVWGSKLAQTPMEIEAPLLMLLASFISPPLPFPQLPCLPSFHYFRGRPPSVSLISLTSLSILSSLIHPHCSFLLLPSRKLYASVGGGLLSSERNSTTKRPCSDPLAPPFSLREGLGARPRGAGAK